MVGETLSHYRITARLGAGATGDVYGAHDLRLRRLVALKVVRLLSGHDTSRRLLAEARAASALSHPNIAVVYEVDEIDRDDGRVGFIAMEYVDGRTLTALAADAPLSLDRILDIGRQVAQGLAHAHERGLVHRDVKPSNVMVTGAGLIKILDFGLALWSMPAIGADASTRTSDVFKDPSTIVGTVAYMSPEQVTGRDVDGRSDMFSLGTVLFELVGGRRPFGGTQVVQLVASLLHNEIPPLQPLGTDPRLPAVERVIRRMLEKDPASRYANLDEAAEALANAARGDGPVAAGPSREWPVLAVTDFENITASADDDWLGTGISETVSADLSGLEGVTVIPRGRVDEQVRMIGRDEAETAQAMRLRAARALGARWVLTGSFQRVGDAVRVTASLLDAGSGRTTRTIKADGRLDEIFALQDRLVRDLAETLRTVIRPTAAHSQDTSTVAAYEAYSKGVVNLRAETYESLDRAVILFERAVSLDPRYARAHLELGVAYATKADYLALGELRTRAEASLRRAIELQPDAVNAWRELGAVLMAMGRESEGFDALRRALGINSADAGAIGSMGRALFIGRARFEEAASWFERAMAANPNAGWWALQLSHCAALLRDFPRGEAAARRAMDLQQAFLSGREGVMIVGASMRLGHLAALQGRHNQAVDHFLQEIAFLNAVDHALRNRIIVELNVRLGAAYLALGFPEKAHAMLDMAIEGFDRRVRLGADEPFTRYYAAAAHALKGDVETATAFLERAAAERPAFTLERARIEPEFEILRDDTRFRRLLALRSSRGPQ